MEDFSASKVRSPASPHVIKLRISEAEAKEVLEKVSSDVPKTWIPRLWKIEKDGNFTLIKIPSTKVTSGEFAEIVNRFKFNLFGK